MNCSEENDQAFIIRIWKERREIKGASPIWRGVIVHVQTGKRRYLHDVGDIIAFINSCIEEMGLKKSLFWQWAVRIRGLKYAFNRPSLHRLSGDESETDD
jgi:hypothetical protein